jgi:hypothetical protein
MCSTLIYSILKNHFAERLKSKPHDAGVQCVFVYVVISEFNYCHVCW